MIGEVLYIAHRFRRALLLAAPTLAAGWIALVAHHHHLF
jgi:hypothetical protein